MQIIAKQQSDTFLVSITSQEMKLIQFGATYERTPEYRVGQNIEVHEDWEQLCLLSGNFDQISSRQNDLESSVKATRAILNGFQEKFAQMKVALEEQDAPQDDPSAIEEAAIAPEERKKW